MQILFCRCIYHNVTSPVALCFFCMCFFIQQIIDVFPGFFYPVIDFGWGYQEDVQATFRIY